MTIQEYINSNDTKLIQLGCGGNLISNWLNTDTTLYSSDAVFLDVTKTFPIDDNSFDRVFSEHVIEHLPYWAGQFMIEESFRILKSGGRIRISCPDLQFLLDLYQNPTELSKQYIDKTKPDWAPYADAIFTLNNYMRDWGHEFIYDKNTLSNSLLAAGFSDITEHKIRESTDSYFENLEADWRMDPGFLQLETMTLEATKP